MPRVVPTQIHLRIVIEAPVAGVLYSLQGKDNHPTGAKRAVGAAPIVLELAVGIAAGNRFSGPYVRREGPTRRFIYVAVGTQAGDAASPWSRRMKIDIHSIDQPLLDAAANGQLLEATIPGAGADGTPSCATVPPLGGWRAV